jgi:galactitol-specific phosphotransferase system IIC component
MNEVSGPSSRAQHWINRITTSLIVLGVGWGVGMPLAESRGGNLIGIAFALPVVLCVASLAFHSSMLEAFRSAYNIAVGILGITLYGVLAILILVGIPILLLFVIVRLVHYFWYM